MNGHELGGALSLLGGLRRGGGQSGAFGGAGNVLDAVKRVEFFFFLIFPTTNTRPEVTGSSVWDVLMRFLYRVDTADNLFPSIHCLTSWFCFIGIRGKKEIPKGYRIFSCLMAVAVFVSTLTTKQHVLYDVVAGMLLAEVSYVLTVKTGFVKKYQSFFEWVDKKLHLKQKPGRV